jgi:biopolymer transport protein ExbD
MIKIPMSKQNRPKPDPMLPLINLSFLLLVFLLLVGVIEQTPMSRDSLPEALVAEKLDENPDAPHYIEITDAGLVFEGKVLQPSDLAGLGKQPIVLLAPRAMPAQGLTHALNALSQAGVTSVRLAVERPAK